MYKADISLFDVFALDAIGEHNHTLALDWNE